jgi:hypothetical protein
VDAALEAGKRLKETYNIKGNLMLSSGHAAANPIIGEWKLAQTNCNAMTRII